MYVSQATHAFLGMPSLCFLVISLIFTYFLCLWNSNTFYDNLPQHVENCYGKMWRNMVFCSKCIIINFALSKATNMINVPAWNVRPRHLVIGLSVCLFVRNSVRPRFTYMYTCTVQLLKSGWRQIFFLDISKILTLLSPVHPFTNPCLVDKSIRHITQQTCHVTNVIY